FALFYPAAIRGEERKLLARYGRAYVEYADRVPAFWPRFGLARSIRFEWSWARYRRNGEYQSAAGVLLAVALLWLKMHLHAYRGAEFGPVVGERPASARSVQGFTLAGRWLRRRGQ